MHRSHVRGRPGYEAEVGQGGGLEAHCMPDFLQSFWMLLSLVHIHVCYRVLC